MNMNIFKPLNGWLFMGLMGLLPYLDLEANAYNARRVEGVPVEEDLRNQRGPTKAEFERRLTTLLERQTAYLHDFGFAILAVELPDDFVANKERLLRENARTLADFVAPGSHQVLNLLQAHVSVWQTFIHSLSNFKDGNHPLVVNHLQTLHEVAQELASALSQVNSRHASIKRRLQASFAEYSRVLSGSMLALVGGPSTTAEAVLGALPSGPDFARSSSLNASAHLLVVDELVPLLTKTVSKSRRVPVRFNVNLAD
jgi:hypothetical protein